MKHPIVVAAPSLHFLTDMIFSNGFFDQIYSMKSISLNHTTVNARNETGRRLLSAILLVAVLFSLAWSLRQTLVIPWNNEQDAWGDFGAYYMAGYGVLNDLPIYDHLEMCRVSKTLGAVKGVPRLGYPPFTALLFVPLAAWFDAVAAFRFCLIAYQLLLWLSVGISLWMVRARLTFDRVCLVVIAISWFTPCWSTLQSGQINMVILFFSALGLLSVSRLKPALSGVFFTIATMIKLFPGIVLLYFALRRRWLSVFAMSLTGVALLGIAILGAGLETHRHYIEVEVPQNAGKILGGNHNIALNSLVYRTIHHQRLTPKIAAASVKARNTTRALRLILLLACAALMLWPRHEDESSAMIRLAICLITAMMINAWTWSHHMVIALPCLAVAGRHLLDGSSSLLRPRSILVLVAYGLMAIGYKIQFEIPWHGWTKELFRSSSLNFFGLLLLWGLLGQQIITKDGKKGR